MFESSSLQLLPKIILKNYFQLRFGDGVFLAYYLEKSWFILNNIAARLKISHSDMFFKIGVLKKFAIFTGKHLCQACNFIKNRLQHRCFPANILKFLKTAVFIEHHRWLLLKENKNSFFISSGQEVYLRTTTLKNFKRFIRKTVTIVDLH